MKFRAFINYNATVTVDIEAENLTEAREIAEGFDVEDFLGDIDTPYGELGDVIPLADSNLDRD